VLGPMLVELATAIALVIWPARGLSSGGAWVGLALVGDLDLDIPPPGAAAQSAGRCFHGGCSPATFHH